jgi:hypothetical protein
MAIASPSCWDILNKNTAAFFRFVFSINIRCHPNILRCVVRVTDGVVRSSTDYKNQHMTPWLQKGWLTCGVYWCWHCITSAQFPNYRVFEEEEPLVTVFRIFQYYPCKCFEKKQWTPNSFAVSVQIRVWMSSRLITDFDNICYLKSLRNIMTWLHNLDTINLRYKYKVAQLSNNHAMKVYLACGELFTMTIVRDE